MSDLIRVKNVETDDVTTMSRDHFDSWELRWPGEFVEVKDESDEPEMAGTVIVTPTEDTAPTGQPSDDSEQPSQDAAPATESTPQQPTPEATPATEPPADPAYTYPGATTPAE